MSGVGKGVGCRLTFLVVVECLAMWNCVAYEPLFVFGSFLMIKVVPFWSTT